MKFKRLATIGLCSTLLLSLVACSQTQKTYDSTAETSVTQTQSGQVSWKASYTNMNSKPSAEEVRKALAAHLDKDSWMHFSILSTIITILLVRLA